MAKVQHISGITKRLPFDDLDFYDLFRVTFENSKLGRMKRLLPLYEMAVNFGLVSNRHERKRGPKPFFSPEGKVALMFLKNYTQLSAPKLLEQLNGNIHYQIFCDISINPLCPLRNYKLIDDIASELADKLRIQQQQDIRTKSHAAGSGQCRQVGRECGYYHLHRNLNQSSLFHRLVFEM